MTIAKFILVNGEEIETFDNEFNFFDSLRGIIFHNDNSIIDFQLKDGKLTATCI